MAGKLNMSDYGGAMGKGAKGLSKTNPRANGQIGEGNTQKAMGGKVRQNGVMPATPGSADVPDPGKYKGPLKSTNQDFRPTKKGSAA